MNIYPFPPPKFNIELPAPQITITLDTPSKGDFYALTAGTDPVKILSRYTDAPLTGVTAAVLAIRYIEQLKAYREANMDFMEVPHTIDFGDTGTKTDKLPCITMAERMVYEHSGLTFLQQNELPVTEFWMLLADAVKFRLAGNDEYLEQCYKDMHKISDF
jgi:hypothetical protein